MTQRREQTSAPMRESPLDDSDFSGLPRAPPAVDRRGRSHASLRSRAIRTSMYIASQSGSACALDMIAEARQQWIENGNIEPRFTA
jgi:hypothetical protein